MGNDKLEIQPITVAEIDDFALRTAAERERIGNVPVSRWRARAWQANPCATADDVVLLVAWFGGRCIGYFGLMPGRLQVHGEIETVNWSSTFYVEEEYNHTCAAIVMLQEATRLGRHLFLTGFSPPVGQLYQATGFRPLGPLSYLAFELHRTNPVGAQLRSLRTKQKKKGVADTQGLDRLVFGADWAFKHATYPLLRFGPRRALCQIETRPLDHIPDMAEPSGGVRFVRDADVVNWMLAEPWYTTDHDKATAGHYFDDYYPVHEYHALEIRGRGEQTPRGWVVLRLHGSRRHLGLTVCDYHLPGEDLGCLAALAIRHGAAALADSVILPKACGDTIAEWRVPRRMVRPQRREYYWKPRQDGSDAEEISKAIELALVDGDMVF
jgi:hypothetical protein